MSTASRIYCCFADKIYKKYQNKKFGINYCNVPEEDEIENVTDLKDIYEYHLQTERLVFEEDPNIVCPVETDCNISSIIELINRL